MTYFDELGEVHNPGGMGKTQELADALQRVIQDVRYLAYDLENATKEDPLRDLIEEEGPTALESICQLHQLIDKLISE